MSKQSVIQILRTPGNTLPQSGLSTGEFVYTYDINNIGLGNTYKKLYIGGYAGAPPIEVGGEYYTGLLPTNLDGHGILSPNKSIVVDADKKIDELRIDDIRVGVTSENIIDTQNSDLILDSSTGKVIIKNDLYVDGDIYLGDEIIIDEIDGGSY